MEKDREVLRILEIARRDISETSRVDLEALEQAVRAAALVAGAKVLEAFLAPVGIGRRQVSVRCACGATMNSIGLRPKSVVTLLGPIRFTRSCYVCPQCGASRFPGDEQLDVVGTSRSPGVRRQTARLAAKESFREVAADMEQLGGVPLCRKEAERIAQTEGRRMEQWMAGERWALRAQDPDTIRVPGMVDTLYVELDGTGVPMVKEALQGRKGKQSDGSAKTREAKVGCVFTQSALDADGNPVRDACSTSYVACIEHASLFGWRLYDESVRRGLYQARRVVVIGDGAEWVKNIAQTHFGHARFIIDYYHAAEHVGELCRVLFDRNERQVEWRRERWTDRLWEGDIETIVKEASELLPKNARIQKAAQTQINYFEKNKEHMRYAQYRAEKMFIGSGVVEAACKNVVGARMKQTAMHWTVNGANDILALRCVCLSNRLEDYWEQRAVA